MNRKRELVNPILDNLERAGVKLSDTLELAGNDGDISYIDKGFYLRCKDSDLYWKLNPTGNCMEYSGCIEQNLACLEEQNLERILTSGGIPENIEWCDLWRSWEAAGYFECAPSIIEDEDHVPILRIWHDAYLGWFRGYCFQNSYDLRANGSKGNSPSDLQLAEACVTCPWYSDTADRSAWEHEYALFRKAIILAYPFSAAGCDQHFPQLLHNYPSLFEEFINRTDKEKMHLNLDAGLTLCEMRNQSSSIKFQGPVAEEITLTQEGGYGVVLRYNEQYVSVSWSESGENRSLTIKIPKWGSEPSSMEDRNCARRPRCENISAYLNGCWYCLTITLLTLASCQVSHNFWCPSEQLASVMDKMTSNVSAEDKRASSLQDVWDELYCLSRNYCN